MILIMMLMAVMANDSLDAVIADRPSTVVATSGEEFLNLTKSADPDIGHLVFFGAPWCGHCKKFKPIFYNMSIQASIDNSIPGIEFIEYEVENLDHAAKLFRVSAYPTLILIKNATYWKYNGKGKRSDESIWHWLDEIYAGEHAGKPYPASLPTFTEGLRESLDKAWAYAGHLYRHKPVVAVSLAVCAVLSSAVIVLAVYLAFTTDADRCRPWR